jgi:hypothetical protein
MYQPLPGSNPTTAQPTTTADLLQPPLTSILPVHCVHSHGCLSVAMCSQSRGCASVAACPHLHLAGALRISAVTAAAARPMAAPGFTLPSPSSSIIGPGCLSSHTRRKSESNVVPEPGKPPPRICTKAGGMEG